MPPMQFGAGHYRTLGFGLIFSLSRWWMPGHRAAFSGADRRPFLVLIWGIFMVSAGTYSLLECLNRYVVVKDHAR